MSWNDPCMECGEPRYGCKCVSEPKIYSESELIERKELQERNKTICADVGHDFQYGFIIYTCTRCGENTDY